jgi:hypothetical protein
MEYYTKRQMELEWYNQLHYMLHECGVCGKRDTLINLLNDSKVKHKFADGHCIIGDIVTADPFKTK